MATLTVIFALSCFEWLPLGLPGAVMQWGSVRTRLPLVEAFLTGMFATLLATPCSAPFVGTAVGFALAAGPAEIIAVFLCLGVGMALPYGAAALFPGVVRYLPRPGAWMLVLRRVLGLVLLATTVWLVAVLQSTAGLGIAILIGITLALLIVFRALVTLGLPDRGRFLARPVTAALAIFAIAAGLLPALPDGRSAQGGGAGWEAFDAAALPGLVASGKTVLVDVTATWCLTCKVNDLAALENHDVASRLTAPGTIRMRADWSRPDPKIAAYLHSFARYGIPLDVVYGPGRPEGEALPEVLTPGTVLAALDRAAPRAHAALR
jgi:suppressor for copper-sensitivity B